MEPISQRKFSLHKSVLKNVEVYGGLDRGCSMTKILYVDKSDIKTLDSTSESITLTAALFPNSGFEDALEWLKTHAVFPENKDLPLHLTGVGSVLYEKKIKEVLGRKATFVEEFFAQARGAYCLLKCVSLEETTFPEVKTDCTETLSSKIKDKVRNQFQDNLIRNKDLSKDEGVLPCIFVFHGSGTGFTYIDSKGYFRNCGVSFVAGRTFLGLSRCILGTNNYNEVTTMAAKGDRRNIDAQVKDILVDDLSPPDLPIVHFGKLSRTRKSIKEFRKEDIAHSLVSMFMYHSLNAVIKICQAENVSNVFFGGNVFQAEIFRKEYSYLKQIYGLDFINVHFMSNGHTGALGAMICDPNDLGEYYQT